MMTAMSGLGLFGRLLGDPEVLEALSAQAAMGRMLAFERAWTQALLAMGVVDPVSAKQAVARIDGFAPDLQALKVASETDGLPVPELVRQLRAGLPEAAQKAIHTGATSQDVLDTSTVLAARDILSVLDQRGQRVLARLDEVQARFGTADMMGRTRMQAALPVTVADRLRAWRAPLAAHLADLPRVMDRVAHVQIGGAVGLRDAPQGQAEAVAHHVANSLGLGCGSVWHTDRSRIIELGQWLALVSGALGKMGQDIALMAQQGIDEVQLSGAGGSSAMPHKQNPVRAEILVGLARVVVGHQGTLGQAIIHEQERSGAAWAIEWLVLPAMFEATGVALNTADQLLQQVERMGAKPD